MTDEKALMRSLLKTAEKIEALIRRSAEHVSKITATEDRAWDVEHLAADDFFRSLVELAWSQGMFDDEDVWRR